MHTSSSRTIATLAKYTQSRRARAHTILGAYATINQSKDNYMSIIP